MKVCVTGADGFIGSHLTEELVRRGYEVKAFVNYNSFGSWGWLDRSDDYLKKSIEIFTGDIRDPHGVKKALEGCEAVFHLAALIGIPFSYHSPDSYVDTNIKGTLNVLQAARELGLKRVLHTSTSEVYGSAITVPIREDHPLQGQSPYSATKIGADQLALSFHRSFDLPVSVVRPFNTYGPRQSARAVIPTTILQMAQGGGRIRLGSTDVTRDFTYVRDTADGFIGVFESDRAVGEVINIGSGFEISIARMTETVAELMGAKVLVEQDPGRVRPKKSEVTRLWADITKAGRIMGWKPRYTGLEGLKRGLSETIEWFREEKNREGYKASLYNV